MPIIEMPTATYTFQFDFLCINKERIGTITVYKAVRNPAFPTVVYIIPTCWNIEATHNAHPHAIPPIHKAF